MGIYIYILYTYFYIHIYIYIHIHPYLSKMIVNPYFDSSILTCSFVLNPRFLRTAKAVEAEPWHLHKAAAYLRAFVESSFNQWT